MWIFLVRHPIWIWIFYFWSTFMVVTEDTLHIPCRYQVNLTQDLSTIPSKRMNLAYCQEYFRDFCWIVLTGLYRDTAVWKAICSARLCWGREEALLWISHLFYVKCDLISLESLLILLLPYHAWQKWHCSLADSTTNGSYFFNKILFCIILTVHHHLGGLYRNLDISCACFWGRKYYCSSFVLKLAWEAFMSMWLTSFSSAVTTVEIYFWLTTKRTTFVNNNNESKASKCNENPC